MPRIVVNAFLTLDGVMQAPGGPDEDSESGFPHGGWQAPYAEDELGQRVVEGCADADGYLFGRKTYDIFAGYWPKVTHPANAIAVALNGLPKHVVSRSPRRLDWHASQQVEGDVVAGLRALRAQPGRTLQTWGSTDLLQTLLRHELVDEFRLFVYPLVLGSGKRLFAEGTVPTAFEAVESASTPKGATFLRLRPRGKPTYGTMGA